MYSVGLAFVIVLVIVPVIAGVPGLEPRQAEPESAGLPITPYPTRGRHSTFSLEECGNPVL